MLEKVFKDYALEQIVGIDEVGRGTLCGPVVACSCILKREIPDLKDSKKLSAKKREIIARDIKANSIYQISEVAPNIIDKINILQASLLAMKNSFCKLIKPDKYIVLVDGNISPDIEENVICIVRGDEKYQSIAAASVLAKVYRDNLMKELSVKFPNYRLDKHFGYATKEHLELIHKFKINISDNLYRLSFNPIKSLLVNDKNNFE